MKRIHEILGLFLAATTMVFCAQAGGAEDVLKFADRNQKEAVDHEYDVTVEVPRGAPPFKIIVAPKRAPDKGYAQVAKFFRTGTKTVYLGTATPTAEKYELLLATYTKGAKVPKEGQIDLDDLEELGFDEVVDSLTVRRTR